MRMTRIALAALCSSVLALASCGEKKVNDERTPLIGQDETVDPQILEEEQKIIAGLANGDVGEQEGLNFTDLPAQLLEGTLQRAVAGGNGFYYVRLVNDGWVSSLGQNYLWGRICADITCGAWTTFDPTAITNYSPYYSRQVRINASYLYNGWGFPYFNYTRAFSVLPLAPAIPAARWVQTNGGNCVNVCAAAGLSYIPAVKSPEGATCASGEVRPHSAVLSGIQFVRGVWPNYSPHFSSSSFSSGAFCYNVGQKQDRDRTDRTVGCYCSGFAF